MTAGQNRRQPPDTAEVVEYLPLKWQHAFEKYWTDDKSKSDHRPLSKLLSEDYPPPPLICDALAGILPLAIAHRTAKNDPFRKKKLDRAVANVLVYLFVNQRIKQGDKQKAAFHAAAEKFGRGEPTVRQIFYAGERFGRARGRPRTRPAWRKVPAAR